jgi:hypothetical protein
VRVSSRYNSTANSFLTVQRELIASIAQSPNFIYWLFTALDRERYTVFGGMIRLGLFDLPKDLFEYYRQRAQAAMDRDVLGPNHQSKSAEVEARSLELAKRIEALKAELAQAPSLSVQEVRIESEIRNLEYDKSKIESKLMNSKLQGRIKICEEIDRQLSETSSSWHVPTTFRPLGVSATSDLLRHGYINCMNICHLLLDGFPRFADPPTVEDMQRLARGKRRKSYRPDSAAAAS